MTSTDSGFGGGVDRLNDGGKPLRFDHADGKR